MQLNSWKRRIGRLLVLAMVLPHVGCATLLNDDHQMVAFNTDPEGAAVAIDGVKMGKTPCVLPVPRKGMDKIVTFSKEGYKTVNYNLKNTLNAALAGNILLGGVIGLGIDAISGRGGGYQDSVSILLEPGSGVVEINEESVAQAKEAGTEDKSDIATVSDVPADYQ